MTVYHIWRIYRRDLPASIARARELGFHGKFTVGDEVICLKKGSEPLTIFILD